MHPKSSGPGYLVYQPKAFEANTDDQGRFAFALVPPGRHTVGRRIALSERSWTFQPVGEVDVKPGETIATNFAPAGRKVFGRIKFSDSDATEDLKQAHGYIRSPRQEIFDRMFNMKSDDERKAFVESEEYKAAMKDFQTYTITIAPNGSFTSEIVRPGKYEISFESRGSPRPDASSIVFTSYVSRPEIIVPEGNGQDEDTPVNLGTVELKKFTRELPDMRASKK